MKTQKTSKRTKLVLARIAKGLSQKDVASQVGVSVTTYCFLETGKTNGTNALWEKIQNVLGIPNADMWATINPSIQ